MESVIGPGESQSVTFMSFNFHLGHDKCRGIALTTPRHSCHLVFFVCGGDWPCWALPQKVIGGKSVRAYVPSRYSSPLHLQESWWWHSCPTCAGQRVNTLVCLCAGSLSRHPSGGSGLCSIPKPLAFHWCLGGSYVNKLCTLLLICSKTCEIPSHN